MHKKVQNNQYMLFAASALKAPAMVPSVRRATVAHRPSAVKMTIAPPEKPETKPPSTLPDKITIPDTLPGPNDPFWDRPQRREPIAPPDEAPAGPPPDGPGGPKKPPVKQ